MIHPKRSIWGSLIKEHLISSDFGRISTCFVCGFFLNRSCLLIFGIMPHEWQYLIESKFMKKNETSFLEGNVFLREFAVASWHTLVFIWYSKMNDEYYLLNIYYHKRLNWHICYFRIVYFLKVQSVFNFNTIFCHEN